MCFSGIPGREKKQSGIKRVCNKIMKYVPNLSKHTNLNIWELESNIDRIYLNKSIMANHRESNEN